jgi:hypothetical protein
MQTLGIGPDVLPNVVVEWLTLLLRIRVTSWPRRPAIPVEAFYGFPQSLQANAGMVP